MGREKFLEVRLGGKALQDSLHPRENPRHPRDSIQHCAGTAQVLLQAVQGRRDGLPSPSGEGLSGCSPELALTGAEASAQEKTTSGLVAGSSLQGSLWGESTAQASS